MKLQFDKKNSDQMELIQAIASKKKLASMEALEIFAGLIGPTISEQYMVEGTSKLFFRTESYKQGEDPALALDFLVNKDESWLSVWTQRSPGGAPTNQVTAPIEEFKLQSFRLDSAISWLKKWAAKGRVDVIAKVLERLYQEILLKDEDNSWYVALAALIGSTNPNTTALGNVFHTQTATLTLDDLNRAITRMRRQNVSWAGGTSNVSAKPDLLIMSPEQEERFRSWSYNPINTKGANDTTGAADSGVVTLTDEDRKNIYMNGSVPNFMGMDMVVLDEFGPTQRYTQLFGSIIGGANIPSVAGGDNDTFDSTTDDVLLAIDSSKDFAFKYYAEDSEVGGTFELTADDQFIRRSDKVGFYGAVEVSPVVLETRGILGIVVN